MTTATPTCHWRLVVTRPDRTELHVGDFADYAEAEAEASALDDGEGDVELFPIDPPPTAEGWFTAEIV